MHWNTWRKRNSTRNWELEKCANALLDGKKVKEIQRKEFKLSHQECIGTLGEKEINKELGIDKGAMLRMENSKRDTMERIKLSHQECIRTLGEKEINKELGIDKGAMHS